MKHQDFLLVDWRGNHDKRVESDCDRKEIQLAKLVTPAITYSIAMARELRHT